VTLFDAGRAPGGAGVTLGEWRGGIAVPLAGVRRAGGRAVATAAAGFETGGEPFDAARASAVGGRTAGTFAVALASVGAGFGFGLAGVALGLPFDAFARALGGGGGVLERTARDSSKNGRASSP